ncbi:hypothetical protein J7426_08440 [Tropicibacter sp. R16_0]|uniref:hypothetical protein n=1 Tax=Tropicibacter sp. R16_0 TaxID=2821102 RepID=UPI001ADCD54E|nr:hypothetical protein [Tropicibacter sp. R16_0]MBO9450278.1 hypothetical protein [Tropicibacter sp. R16_0]
MDLISVFQSACLRNAAYGALLSLSAVVLPDCALAQSWDPATSDGKYIVNPKVELAKPVKRQVRQGGRRGGTLGFYGAIAVSQGARPVWHETRGYQSMDLAVEVAIAACEVKAGRRGGCRVAAVTVPDSYQVTFEQSLRLTGLSRRCVWSLDNVRSPRKRSTFSTVGGCVSFFASPTGSQNRKEARKAGHTLAVAANGLFAAALVFGPEPQLAKRKALELCKNSHDALQKGLVKPKFRDPGSRIRNRAELELELRAFQSVIAKHKKAATCQILGSEILK